MILQFDDVQRWCTAIMRVVGELWGLEELIYIEFVGSFLRI